MMRRLLTAALVLPLLLSACGEGDDQDGAGTDPTAAGAEAESSDHAAVEDTIVAWLLEGDCDLATDEYLAEIAWILDEPTREEACEYYESTFVEPLYTEEDILISDVEVADGVATLEIGSEWIDITTLYELTQVDGSWLVSCDDFTCDRL